MVEKGLDEFIQDLSDPDKGQELRKAVMACGAVATAARAHGYHFTAQELDEWIEKHLPDLCRQQVTRFCFSEAPGF